MIRRISGPVVQCPVNFSEGRDLRVIHEIVEAVRSECATVADWSADPDHNRLVVTILDSPDVARRAVLAGAMAALERIDMTKHHGAHPRIGAIDVVPFVPIRGVTMEECIELSRQAGEEIGRLGIPVYLYERSAVAGRRSQLPDIRRGGFEGLFTAPLEGERAADFGPNRPHPTAGAAVVGARAPLVAFNVNLDTPDAAPARAVAARIRAARERDPLLSGVRALGMRLASRGISQVSMNLTRPLQTPLPAVFDFVQQEADRLGIEAAEAEIIGLIPKASLGGEPPERIRWRAFRESQILESWLE